MQKFEQFCVGQTHEAYESYKFHLKKQEQGETIEAYVASLRQLAKKLQFWCSRRQDDPWQNRRRSQR